MRLPLLVLAACSSSSQPPQTIPRVVKTAPADATPIAFRSECVPKTDPSIATVSRQARDASEASFKAQLAREHLHVLPLGAHSVQIAEGMSSAHGAQEGTTVRKTIEGVRGVFVAAETSWTGGASRSMPWEFVQDDRGHVYRLIRQARPAVTRGTLCACAPPEERCRSYGSPCPACGSTDQIMYGPLPAGAHYKGELVLVYPTNEIALGYDSSGLTCPPAPECLGPPA
jgi:hypothetical protein